MLIVLLQTLLLLVIIIDLLLIMLWVFNFKEEDNTNIKKPLVSVLVSARNEEKNIASCLENLSVLAYPDYEILVGNDHSTDKTADIAQQFAKQDNRIKVYEIKSAGPTKGKANVLAQLAPHANGEVLFFTDADVKVPAAWITAMLKGFNENTGLVTGITGVSGNDLWSRFQNLDWLIALGMVKIVSDMGYPVTALGNNMAVSGRAYNMVGGFESIPFSVTEDFELLKQIAAKGYSSKKIINPQVYAVTEPEKSLNDLLHQRKRWMKGALQLPFLLVLLLVIQALFFPLLLLLIVFSPAQAVFLLVIKIIIQSGFISFVSARIEKKAKMKELILYEFYFGFLSLILLFFYFLPTKVRWKGREY